ncbi:MAG: nitrogen regulation protein NR(I) [Proteobacteria bacterium]|nr:nitrogen regulation protein NR(I) [Pseudomonadota bacterium]
MSKPEAVWIVDDDKSIRWVVEKALQKAGIGTRNFSDARDLLAALNTDTPDALITDIRMPGMDGLQLLDKIQISHPDLPVIVMTAHSDLESAVSAFHGGAFEYLPKPFDIKEVVDLAHRAVQHGRRRKLDEQKEPATLATTPEIIGAAPAMQEVFRAIGRLARSHITVLINGESGTGKELVAKALHRHSPRAKNPFIALNMAAIPKDLMESELFGHVKGSFTGAQARRSGRFEQANGGTLFLDEIGDMPAELQTRLLRVLPPDGEFYPVGGHTVVKVDVRIIAATHQNLEILVEQGRFREDLFHRLNVIRIHIPALRERKQDIPLLLRHFLMQAAQELNTEVKLLTQDAERFLSGLEWPGNVRQLENSCRWLTVMASGRQIQLDDLPPELLNTTLATEGAVTDWEASLRNWIDQQLIKRVQSGAANHSDVAKQTIPIVETILIKAALDFTRGRRHEAALLLGYGRNTLARKVKELGIEE